MEKIKYTKVFLSCGSTVGMKDFHDNVDKREVMYTFDAACCTEN